MEKPLVLEINKSPYGWELFESNVIKINDKINIFAGPNGYGKSSLILMMKEFLKQQNYKEFELTSKNNNDKNATKGFLSYDAKYDSYNNILGSNLYQQNFELAATMMEASEGQNKIFIMADLFNQIKTIKTKSENENLEQIIVFIDGIESGLSIDMIQFMMKTLPLKIQQVENLGLECILIFTTNNYEMCRNRIVIDQITFREIKYESYEDFCNDMLQKSMINSQ